MEANLETVIRISIRPAPSSTQSQRRRRAGEEGSRAPRSHRNPRADPEPPRTHAQSLLGLRCRRSHRRSGTLGLGPSPRLPAARPRLRPGAGRSRCLRARACPRSRSPHTPPSAPGSGLRGGPKARQLRCTAALPNPPVGARLRGSVAAATKLQPLPGQRTTPPTARRPPPRPGCASGGTLARPHPFACRGRCRGWALAHSRPLRGPRVSAPAELWLLEGFLG